MVCPNSLKEKDPLNKGGNLSRDCCRDHQRSLRQDMTKTCWAATLTCDLLTVHHAPFMAMEGTREASGERGSSMTFDSSHPSSFSLLPLPFP
ncbi:hypothetical protein E2C01_000164 [Portunus trituberculatus]|uniref:Uncharacterized protein n=1 Tax=Portunus trituberculatus TaxID=210409 RepID=A0A5B7CEG5_PORTR|nr:hypothetical protein [Portunus trituberculatus]